MEEYILLDDAPLIPLEDRHVPRYPEACCVCKFEKPFRMSNGDIDLFCSINKIQTHSKKRASHCPLTISHFTDELYDSKYWKIWEE